jgi:hypothetical protein
MKIKINREIRKVSKKWKHPRQEGVSKGKSAFKPLFKEECEELMGDDKKDKLMLYNTISYAPMLPGVYESVDELIDDAVKVPIVGTEWFGDKGTWRRHLILKNEIK